MEAIDIDKLPDNIKSRLKIVDDHWIWTGATVNNKRKDKKGRVRYYGENRYVHRVVFHILKGFNLYGHLQANHKRECPYSLCCNPDHLYAGTQKDNVLDSIILGHNKELNKTRCKTCGGGYSTSPTDGKRYCQTCKNRRRALWRLRK